MADKKISQLTTATTPLVGTEVVPIVQGSSTVKVPNNDLRPKQIQANATSGVLQVTGPTDASIRVMTTPNADFTVARTDAAQSFTGNQTVSAGNLVIGTSGKGIDFSATSDGSGTTTSELLADYEEGTWTPVLGGISGTSGQSYSKQVGRYTKIGRMVFFTFEATLTAKGSLSSEAIVGGLPYTIGSEIGYTSADINTFANLGQSVVDITLKANPGDTTFYVWATTAAATSSDYTISWQIYTDTTTLRGGGMYIAA